MKLIVFIFTLVASLTSFADHQCFLTDKVYYQNHVRCMCPYYYVTCENDGETLHLYASEETLVNCDGQNNVAINECNQNQTIDVRTGQKLYFGKIENNGVTLEKIYDNN